MNQQLADFLEINLKTLTYAIHLYKMQAEDLERKEAN